MSNERAREIEERGIEAAKAGQKDEARKLLQHALRLDPVNDNAWLWLASVAKDKRERLLCLQKVLEINPQNEMGIKAVQAMGIDPAQLLPQRTTIDSSLAAEDDSAEDDIPLPSADFIKDALARVDALTESHIEVPQNSRINWTRKQKGRAGEREIWVLRAQIGTAVSVFGAFVIGLLTLVVSNSPEVQLVLFGASPTPRPPTATATSTLTPRPDINPTATATIDFTSVPTFTATPTINQLATRWPLDLNNNPVYATPTPTAVYLGFVDNAVSTAIGALQQESNYQDAVQQVRLAQDRAGSDFQPHPYYFEALLSAQLGDYPAAIEALNRGQAILDDTSVNAVVSRADARNFQPMINAGFLQVYMHEIRAARLRGNQSIINDRINRMEPLFRQAYEIDPNYGEPVALMAEAYIARGRYDDAINVTEQALNQNLASNTPVIAMHGRAYLERGFERLRRGQQNEARQDFARAQYIGYYGTLISPFSEPAHELRVEATIALNEIALASVYTNEFLFYRPDSAVAYRLLASVRAAENKPEFALDIFTQALEQENAQSSTQAEIFVERAVLYEEQRRFDLAQADYSRAYELLPDFNTLYRRMLNAYQAGDTATAFADADALIEADLVGQDDARLIRARIIVDEGRIADYDSALDGLNIIFNRLSTAQRYIVSEYQARIYLERNDLPNALSAINRAIAGVETGSRRYLRGIIYETRGERENAIADYAWIMLWNQVFDYPFAGDVELRLTALQSDIAGEAMQATATVVAATQAVFDVTATYEAELALTASPTPPPTPTDEFDLQDPTAEPESEGDET